MDIKETQLYIVTQENGIHTEEPITMKVFNNFQDGSQLVQLNETVFGVYKNHSTDPKTAYIDDLDIIKSDLAELLDISHENNQRIISEEQNLGIFTELNYSQNIESRISITTILQNVINSINSGKLDKTKASYYNRVLNMQNVSANNPIEDEEAIKDIIDLGINALKDKIELETNTPMGLQNEKNIEKSYIRMILFDYIVNRKYRSYDYSIITTLNANNTVTWEKYYFAPISVSNSLKKDNEIADGTYVLNNKYIKKEKILKVLYKYYYEDIKRITETFTDAIKLYNDAFARIIYNNTDLATAKDIEAKLNKNIEEIIKEQQEKESKEFKEKKLNKVERTMVTQSINVKITNKLDLIQKKYPVNLKEHPELLKSLNTNEKNEKVKLIVEEEKNKKSGFTNSIVLTSIVALICGIGAGIVTMILIIGN